MVLGGLAPDRGLYVPESIPQFSPAEIEGMKDFSFDQLAVAVISKYVSTDEIPAADLQRLVKASTANFRDKDVTPVVKTGDFWTLELFHGPTFAFKDVALQFLGNLFEFFIQRKPNPEDRMLTIMGATSGDTGGAAIYGLRGKKGVNCFILYPKGRVSLIQEQQMTTVPDENIHCLRIEGTFDDCQDVVKGAFMDTEFRKRVKLGAVNSINWARVLAQMTYYFFAYFQVAKQQPGGLAGKGVSFSVPTGNFGDILAGYYAKRMGLPVDKLVVGTNENDILARFFASGTYCKEKIAPSISPSMDICVSSNFERYLFHLLGDDANGLRNLMGTFEGGAGGPVPQGCSAKAGTLSVSKALLAKATVGDGFLAARANTSEVLDSIAAFHARHNYLYCPHSACGVVAAQKLGLADGSMVVLATAHVGKFYNSVKKSVDPLPPLPPALAAVQTMKMRMTDLPLSLAACQAVVLERCGFTKPVKGGIPAIVYLPIILGLGLMVYHAMKPSA